MNPFRRLYNRIEWWVNGSINSPDWLHRLWRWCERVIYCHHNARVLADMEYRFACVLTSCTRTMSKAYYNIADMQVEIEDYIQSERDDAVREFLAGLPPQKNYTMKRLHEESGLDA